MTANASPRLLEDFLLFPIPFAGVLGSSPWLLQGHTSGALRAHLYKSPDLGLRDGLWELREPSDGMPEIRYKPSYTQGFRFFSGGLVSISLLILGPLNSDVQKHPFHHLTI